MFRIASVVLLAAGFLAAPAVALEDPVPVYRYPSPYPYSNPSPAPRNLADNYPEKAAQDEVEGWAQVRCVVQTTGRLAECVVLKEAPQGYGFGAAAVKTMTEYGKADLNKDGPGKRVMLTQRFTLGG